MSLITAWFDGSCEPHNPGGHAGWGAIVEVDGRIVFEASGYEGHGPKMSNNVAEYCGCIAVLDEIAKYDGKAVVYGDSQLVIYQMCGRFRAKRGLYLPYFDKAKLVLDERIGRERVRFEWIPRDKNKRCDALSKKALEDRGVRVRDQAKFKKLTTLGRNRR